MNAFKVVSYAAFVGLLIFAVVNYNRNQDSNKSECHHDNYNTNQDTSVNDEHIRDLIKDVIAKNPELIVNSVEAYHRSGEKAILSQKAKLVADIEKQIISDPLAPGVGEGKNVIIEFVDYSCIFCKEMLNTKVRALSEIDDLRIIIKDISIINEWSSISAKAAVAVSIIDPTKYFAFHSKLLELGSNPVLEDIDKIAISLGIDPVNLRSVMDGAAVEDVLQSNMELASKLELRGTPAYIINGILISGAVEVSEITEALSTTHQIADNYEDGTSKGETNQKSDDSTKSADQSTSVSGDKGDKTS